LARGLSYFTIGGFFSTEAAQAYARAGELAEQRSNTRQLVMAVYGLWLSAAGSGTLLASRPLSDRLLS